MFSKYNLNILNYFRTVFEQNNPLGLEGCLKTMKIKELNSGVGIGFVFIIRYHKSIVVVR